MIENAKLNCAIEQPGWTELYAVAEPRSLMRASPEKKRNEIEAGNNVSGVISQKAYSRLKTGAKYKALVSNNLQACA